uniref:SJCHGC01879 protein n=1 Tax=Schistosoma japonicum TaxID=6182 RepID=Q5DC98_SCHJA|nr:SJCHGC01879 protein [Schistosoma japonicum]
MVFSFRFSKYLLVALNLLYLVIWSVFRNTPLSMLGYFLHSCRRRCLRATKHLRDKCSYCWRHNSLWGFPLCTCCSWFVGSSQTQPGNIIFRILSQWNYFNK